MLAINVFDSIVALHHCSNKDIFTNQTLKNSLNFVWSLDEVRFNIDRSQKGNAFTTCGICDRFPLRTIPGGEELFSWINEKILESSSHFVDFKPSTVIFGRTWANIMFYGCEGTCHTHPRDLDGVAIFYLNVPPEGSELVFINNGHEDTYIDVYSSKDLMQQRVISGDLVIHKPNLPHAVSKHNTQEPRICFIYEFKYH